MPDAAVPDAVLGEGPRSARLLLAPGLIVSAGLVWAVGGAWGYVIGAIQLALGVTIFLRPQYRGAVAGAMVALVPAPLAAIRHWTAGLPDTCRCAQLPHPPPGVISVTGLAVAFQLVLLGSVLWFTSAHRPVAMSSQEPSPKEAP